MAVSTRATTGVSRQLIAPQPRWRVAIVLGDALASAGLGIPLALLWLPDDPGPLEIAVSLAVLSWSGLAVMSRGHGSPNLGIGGAELRRTALLGGALIASVSTGFVLIDQSAPARPPVIVLSVLVASALAIRISLRAWLRRNRLRGLDRQRAVVVGHAEAAAAFTRELRRDRGHGIDVVALCTPDGALSGSEGMHDLPLGAFESTADLVRQEGAHIVTVLACPELDRGRLRRLAWDLELLDADLMVAPGLMEVATPRLAVRPVGALPLLHLGTPELRGSRRILKSLADRLMAALALLVLAVPMLAIGAIVRATSPGPVLFRQDRIGRDGARFRMVKYRSMIDGAEAHRDAVSHLDVHGGGHLFKVRNDPRVTRIGAWLRRYSLDELPQLINVLTGDMSLVGPRPALPAEVAAYDDDTTRRLRVKPGITGLWQVSGRSDLSVEESARLDLWYVDNWSLPLDLLIAMKTIGAVLGRRGAY